MKISSGVSSDDLYGKDFEFKKELVEKKSLLDLKTPESKEKIFENSSKSYIKKHDG